MTTLRFSRALYSGRAVDEALKRFAGVATATREQTDEHWVVHVTASKPALQRRVCGELGNHALALTIARGGPTDPEPPDP